MTIQLKLNHYCGQLTPEAGDDRELQFSDSICLMTFMMLFSVVREQKSKLWGCFGGSWGMQKKCGELNPEAGEYMVESVTDTRKVTSSK